MEVHQDFLELLELFNERGVDFLIIGGYAVAFHGAPRFTGDIDLLIAPDKRNVEMALAALDAFGFPVQGLNPSEVVEQGQILQLGRQPYQIHVMTSISGPSWDRVWKDKVPGNYGKCPTYFIGKASLLENKRATGRNKDLADVDALEGR